MSVTTDEETDVAAAAMETADGDELIIFERGSASKWVQSDTYGRREDLI